jgi:plasmid stabilization system protein ParE
LERTGHQLLSGPEMPVTFVLRIAPRAARDFDAALVRIADLEGDEAAKQWAEGFRNFFATLAMNPRRYVLAPDAGAMSGEVRNVTYRRAEGNVPYRLIYRVTEKPEGSPSVQLLHIRHGAARPLTRKETREIEAQNRELG